MSKEQLYNICLCTHTHVGRRLLKSLRLKDFFRCSKFVARIRTKQISSINYTIRKKNCRHRSKTWIDRRFHELSSRGKCNPCGLVRGRAASMIGSPPADAKRPPPDVSILFMSLFPFCVRASMWMFVYIWVQARIGNWRRWWGYLYYQNAKALIQLIEVAHEL